MKTIKINRPQYVGVLAPLIQKYWTKINEHKLNHITYETLYAYFSQVVQFGGEMAEFWVCFDDEENPVGFALWNVLPLPHQGTVYCQHLFKVGKEHEIVLKLMKEYIEFGKKHHAPYYMFDAVNQPVANAIQKIGKEMGADLIETGKIQFIGRLK